MFGVLNGSVPAVVGVVVSVCLYCSTLVRSSQSSGYSSSPHNLLFLFLLMLRMRRALFIILILLRYRHHNMHRWVVLRVWSVLVCYYSSVVTS